MLLKDVLNVTFYYRISMYKWTQSGSVLHSYLVLHFETKSCNVPNELHCS